MKELNVVLENSLDKANTKKMARIGKEGSYGNKDMGHQVRVKETEIANTGNSIEKYRIDI